MAEQDNEFPAIVCDNADNWEPYEGDPSDLFSQRGLFMFELLEIAPRKPKKAGGNYNLRIVQAVVDDPKCPAGRDKGKKITHYMPYTGVYESGPNQGKANATRLYAFQHACGRSLEDVRKQQGKALDVQKFCAEAMKKKPRFCANVQEEWYEEGGRYQSKIRDYVALNDKWRDQIAVGAHRQELSDEARAQFEGKAAVSNKPTDNKQSVKTEEKSGSAGSGASEDPADFL